MGLHVLGSQGKTEGEVRDTWFGHEVKWPWAVPAVWAATWLSQGLVDVKQVGKSSNICRLKIDEIIKMKWLILTYQNQKPNQTALLFSTLLLFFCLFVCFNLPKVKLSTLLSSFFWYLAIYIYIFFFFLLTYWYLGKS